MVLTQVRCSWPARATAVHASAAASTVAAASTAIEMLHRGQPRRPRSFMIALYARTSLGRQRDRWDPAALVGAIAIGDEGLIIVGVGAGVAEHQLIAGLEVDRRRRHVELVRLRVVGGAG